MLTQAEADALIAADKDFVDPQPIYLKPGLDESHDLQSKDRRERFILDIWRGTIRLSKARYQTRGRKAIILVRLDFGGAPHTNPDESQVGPDHMHVYREGYEDRWAVAADPAEFHGLKDMGLALEDFCVFCHIQGVPQIQVSLI